MARIEIFTSRRDYTLNLGGGIDARPRCNLASWLWNAYELLGIGVEDCADNDPLIRYLSIHKRLREERSVGIVMKLKNELMKTRRELRNKCPDQLLCLANRLYEYNNAVNTLYGYYLRIHELNPEELSKLSIAFNRYNMPMLSLNVFSELLHSSSNNELKHLTFLSLFDPVMWPLHITMDVKILQHLNWVLMYLDNHYVILIMNLNRAYVISDLNININGGRIVLRNDRAVRKIMNTHVYAQIESVNNHGVLFMGNWSDDAVHFNLDFKPREGSIKGLSLDANISQLIPIIVPPHDYLSIKYSI